MTRQNHSIAKYRVYGIMIIVATLFVVSFAILLIDEQVARAAIDTVIR